MENRYNTYHVFSRTQAEEYASQPHSETSVIVSIHANSERPAIIVPNMSNKIKSVLFMQFDDTDRSDENAISENQARKIAGFVLTEKADRLIIHCGAGTSRSAGVCAAIMKYFTSTDKPIFDSPKYRPNMRCYRLVLTALHDW